MKATMTYSRFSKGKLAHEHYAEFESYYPYCSDFRKNTHDDYTTVSVAGPHYSFRLYRENDNEGWGGETVSRNVPQVSINDWKYPTPYHKILEEETVGYRIYSALCVGLQTGCVISLPGLLSLEGLVLNRLEYVMIDDKEVLYMDVDYTHENNVIPNNNTQNQSRNSEEENYNIHGEIWLDTEYFLITKAVFYETLSSQEITASITCRYDTISGIPLPKHYKKVGQVRDEEGVSEWSIEYDFHSFQKSGNDSERFTLSYYGLPEPDFGENSMNRLKCVMMVA